MENRFGFKDLLLTLLLLALIFSVWLSMRQYDRQWETVKSINQKLDSLTRELTGLRRDLSKATIRSGTQANHTPSQNTSVSPSTPAPTAPTDAAFARIHAAKAQPDFAQGDWLVDAFGGGVAKLTPLLSGDVYASVRRCTRLSDSDMQSWRPIELRQSRMVLTHIRPVDPARGSDS